MRFHPHLASPVKRKREAGVSPLEGESQSEGDINKKGRLPSG